MGRVSTREDGIWGAALRRRRKALGLTQRELAEQAGCGPVFIYHLEAGKLSLQLDKVCDVLRVLGLALRLEVGEKPVVVDESVGE